jgi:uncharacterized membrane protein YdjX (TVP38/TMEM64 family)
LGAFAVTRRGPRGRITPALIRLWIRPGPLNGRHKKVKRHFRAHASGRVERGRRSDGVAAGLSRSPPGAYALMTAEKDSSSTLAGGCRKFSLRRLAPLIAVALLSVVAIAMGWHREISFEALARHHEELRNFIAGHAASALAGYIALYIAVVGLSLPVGAYLTVIGGILFGTVLGAVAAVAGASIGAILVFSIARSALGELLVRRAGGAAEKIAQGFREDAFSYLLFLRLVPVFPFWLVNLVPALCGVRLAPFAAATVLGIMPATFAFAFVGSGLESVMVAQEKAYAACLAAGHADCRLMFHAADALTPRLIAAFVALGVLALVPIVVKRLRARSRITPSMG